MEQPASWRTYVRRLCADAWALDDATVETVLGEVESLIASEEVSDPALAQVLAGCGVTRSSAEMIAPSIRVVITGLGCMALIALRSNGANRRAPLSLSLSKDVL